MEGNPKGEIDYFLIPFINCRFGQKEQKENANLTMDSFRIKPSRYPSRSSQETLKVQQALRSALFCTLAFTRDGRNVCLPTGYCFDKDYLYIHGSVKSGFLLDVLLAEEICINAFSAQALVLAPTAFDHSINYQSVNIYAKAEECFEPEDKRAVLEMFTERYIPGRMNDLPAIESNHLIATRVLRFSLQNSIVKERTGAPSYPEADSNPDIWCGLIPMKNIYETPVSDEFSKHLNSPEYFELD